MPIVKFQGGLGNQMFQYAFGKAKSLKFKKKLVLDTGYYQNQGTDTPRKYALACFVIKSYLLNNFVSQLINNNFFSKVFKRLPFYYKEKNANKFDNEIEKTKFGYFDGYWQTEKYFLDTKDAIIKDFQLKQESEKFIEWKNGINKNSASIHIRRGDYVNHAPTIKVLNLCGVGYYQAAIDYIINCNSDIIFYLFSDDSAWAVDNLDFRSKEVIVVSGKDLVDYEELILMSKCKHHIIANSSFSWWGAWLGEKDDSIIIAPQNWFVNEKLKNNDIIPERWVKL
ncbi:MAG: alpha-1,2-fucosyltransferase [Patescibacteria group bacterium]|nr:alpha-1,2-fucosyltransferase [Patescibacteria group bacterium]